MTFKRWPKNFNPICHSKRYASEIAHYFTNNVTIFQTSKFVLAVEDHPVLSCCDQLGAEDARHKSWPFRGQSGDIDNIFGTACGLFMSELIDILTSSILIPSP